VTDILDNPAFQSELERIARDSGRPIADLRVQAGKALAEMHSSRHSLAVRTFAALGRFVYRRGYHKHPVYDLGELEQVRSESKTRSIVFLVSHKTYLDFFVLFDFLYSQGIATPYIFGGLNMNFAGFGGLARRAGGIFIRRSFKDDLVYKAVLRRYIESLVESGCCFMWAIEGTRSRTGKLLTPRMGLLNYVSQVSESLGEDALSYIPVSVVYDQIPDVVDMAAQEAGAEKKGENLSWFMKYVRGLVGNFGSIYIRFGDAMAISDTPDAPQLESSQTLMDERQIEIQKLAFETCYRINEITPATITSLVMMVLLCRGSCSEARIRKDVADLNQYVGYTAKRVNSSRPSRALGTDPAGSIDSLIANGVILGKPAEGSNTGGHPNGGRILSIAPDRVSVAIYYSNMAVHHFVISAFTELALLHWLECAETDLEACLSAEFQRLRDLFKFEFFFPRKPVFLDQLLSELSLLEPDWRHLLHEDRDNVVPILKQKPILVAAGVLSPFVTAYQVVGNTLDTDAASRKLPDKTFIAQCLESNQKQVAGNSWSIPGVSRALLANGLLIADNRKLRRGDDSESAARRADFLQELKETEEALVTLKALADSG